MYKGENMSKIEWKSGTFIYPIPAVLVTSGDMENSNILTVAWTGIINTNPAMCYISVRPERYSYNLIKETGEFVINLTTEELAYATDWCGVRSGRDFDKFKEMKLTPLVSQKVTAPGIAESPVNIECKVVQELALGSHTMFVGEVVNVTVEDAYMNETGKFELNSTGLVSYSHGEYFLLGEKLGKFGYSVQKKK